ncbi:hypothetical protein CC2G_014714 [Coprinopsis cinerea AmutBmut pab1-1]|nr:hypothetical protein CC2G_014714 [Coprinopsis cinerea AmutBmut pab1-1]
MGCPVLRQDLISSPAMMWYLDSRSRPPWAFFIFLRPSRLIPLHDVCTVAGAASSPPTEIQDEILYETATNTLSKIFWFILNL